MCALYTSATAHSSGAGGPPRRKIIVSGKTPRTKRDRIPQSPPPPLRPPPSSQPSESSLPRTPTRLRHVEPQSSDFQTPPRRKQQPSISSHGPLHPPPAPPLPLLLSSPYKSNASGCPSPKWNRPWEWPKVRPIWDVFVPINVREPLYQV